MQVIIPLAGKGSRLRPHTITKPKPLMPIAGKPILAHILDDLKNLNVNEIIFITGYLKEKIEEYVKKNYDYKCRFIEQTKMDGTAGAIKLAQEFIHEDVLIIYADTIFETDLRVIDKAKIESNVDGIIWVKEVEDYSRFGVVVKDANNFMIKIVEKPKEPISKLANIGVYYVKNYTLMFEGIDYIYKYDIKLGNEYFLTDAFSYMINQGSKILTCEVTNWYDCGKFETMLDSNRLILSKYHHDDGENYLKEQNLHARKNVINSIIIDPVFIGNNAYIENSVIGPNVSIADNSHIVKSIIEDSIIDNDSKLIGIKLKNSTIGEKVLLTGKFKKLNIGDYSEINFE